MKKTQSIFFEGNKKNLFFSVLSGLLVAASRLSIAWILQNVIDYIAGKNNLKFSQIVLITVVTFSVLGIAMVMDYTFSPRFSAKAIGQYKCNVFGRIMNKSSGSFLDEDTSTYLSLFSNDIEKIKKDYLDQIEAFVEIVITLAGAVIMMLLCSPLLASISLVISILPLFFSIRAGKSITQKEQKLAKQNALYVSFIKDALSGFSVIKSFRAEKKVIYNHEDCNEQLINSLICREQAVIAVSSISHFLGNVSQIAIFLVCAAFAGMSEKITAGTVVLFIQLMNSVIRPIEVIPKMWAGREAILGLLDAHEVLLNKNVSDEGKNTLAEGDNEIDVRTMSYSYEDDNIVLKDINVHFNAGKCYLIVGESGSGKTTLFNVLSGIRKDYKGSIRYGDNELKDISRNSLYEYISIIQQNVYIFNDTIKNNITMYDSFCSEDIEKAIALAGLDKVIAEKGKDYLCGEGGNQLSGGEKQRIAIARSILRKQKVLFIDEATSALDIETSKKINRSILELEGTTRFIISHSMDMNLVHNCDEIVAIRNGAIVEKGSFESLMERRGYFYSLYVLSMKE